MLNVNMFKNAKPARSAVVSRYNTTTLEQARNKVVTKLQDNINYFQGKLEKVDTVYKQDGSECVVGAKYGNRWIKNLFGDTDHIRIAGDDLVDTLETLITAIEAGKADECIKQAVANNKRNCRDK